jgi:uncharacterized membrane protein YgcG
MAEFQVRSDAVDVEHIMRQIRQRIKEKRGVDYSEEELRALASVKLEKFLDPAGVRSDLVQQLRQAPPDEPWPNFVFEDTTLYGTHRGLLRGIRRLLNPLLKLFFNPAVLVDALHIQSQINRRIIDGQVRQRALDDLRYEVMHNLVLELTRTSIEVRNLKMRLDAMAGRLDFDERRQRAFEGVVEYKKPEPRPRQNTNAPSAPGGSAGSAGSTGSTAAAAEGDEGAQRSKRRRRRRRRVPSAGMPSGQNGTENAEGSGGSGGSAGSAGSEGSGGGEAQ